MPSVGRGAALLLASMAAAAIEPYVPRFASVTGWQQASSFGDWKQHPKAGFVCNEVLPSGMASFRPCLQTSWILTSDR